MTETTETWFELQVQATFGWHSSAAWKDHRWKSYVDCFNDVTAYHPSHKLTERQRIVKKTLITEVMSE